MKLSKQIPGILVGALMGSVLVGTSAFSADDVSESRTVAKFSKIEVRGAIDLAVTVGGTQSVEVKTDKDFMDKVTTEVDGLTLIIDIKKSKKKYFWNDDEDVTVTLSMASFEALDVRGAVDGKIDGIKGGDVSVSISGAADLKMSGSCGAFDLSVSGAADIDAEALKCEMVKARLSGAAEAKVYASKSADLNVSGVGEIDLYGNPSAVSKHVSGFGDISVKK